MVIADGCQRHVGSFIQLLPRATLRILPLNVVGRIGGRLGPVEHHRPGWHQGVGNLHVQHLGLPSAEGRAKRGITIDEHHGVGDVGVDDVAVGHILLHRAVYIHQSHGLGQVGAQLSHHHGHAYHALLLIVDLHDSVVRVGVSRLPQTGLSSTID